MSKKIEEINWDDDFDFDFDEKKEGGFAGARLKGGRRAIVEFTGSFLSGIKKSLLDPSNQRKILEQNAPVGFTAAFDAVSAGSRATKEIYGETKEEFLKGLGDVDQDVKTITAKYGKHLPTRLVDRLEAAAEKTAKRTYAEPTEEEELATGLDAILADVAKAQRQSTIINKKNQVESTSQIVASQIGTTSAILTTNKILSNISRNTDLLVGLNTAQARLQRKHIELTFQQTVLQRQTLDVLQQTKELQTRAFESLIKNTGLPEHIKATMWEVTNRSFKTKLVGMATERVTARFGDVFSKAVGQMKTNARYKADGLGGTIAQLLGAGSMYSDMGDMMGSRASRAGDMAGGIGGALLQWQLRKKLGDKYKNDPRFKVYGDNIQNIMSTAPGMFNKLQDQYGGFRQLTEFLGIGDLKAEDSALNVKVRGNGIRDLDAHQAYNRKSQIALTEVIPGWLAKMDHKLAMIASGDRNIEAQTFDWERGTFTSMSDLKKRTANSMFNKHQVKDARGRAHQLVNALDSKKELDKKDRAILMRYVMEQANSDTGYIDPSALTNAAKSPIADIDGGAATRIAAVLSNSNNFNNESQVIQNNLSGGKESIFSNVNKNAGYQSRMANANSLLNDLRVALPNGMRTTLEHADTGNIEMMRDLGYVSWDKDAKEWRFDQRKYLESVISGRGPGGGSPGFNQGGKGNSGPPPGPMGTPSGGSSTTPPVFAQPNSPYTGGAPVGVDGYTQFQRDLLEAIELNSAKTSVDVSNQVLEAIRQRLDIGIPTGAPQETEQEVKRKSSIFRKLLGATSRIKSDGKSFLSRAMQAQLKIAALPFKMFTGSINAGASVGTRLIQGVFGSKSAKMVSSASAKFGKMMGDVYIQGRDKAAMTIADIRSGKYRDQATGKVIQTLKDIKGAVVDDAGNVVISADDFKAGLFTLVNGKRFSLIRGALSAAGSLLKINTLPFRMAQAGVKGALGLVKKLWNDVSDVYVSGEKSPRILARVMSAGGYFNRDGRIIKSVRDITGDVLDSEGNVILSVADMSKGLVDKLGRPFKGIRDKVFSAITMPFRALRAGYNGAKAGVKFVGKIGVKLAKLNIAALRSPFTLGKSIYSMIKGEGSSAELKVSAHTADTIDAIYNLLDARMPRSKGSWTDRDGSGFRDGSREDVLSRNKPKDKAAPTPENTASNERRGILGMLMAMVGGIGTVIGTMRSWFGNIFGMMRLAAQTKMATSAFDAIGALAGRGRRGRGLGRRAGAAAAGAGMLSKLKNFGKSGLGKTLGLSALAGGAMLFGQNAFAQSAVSGASNLLSGSDSKAYDANNLGIGGTGGSSGGSGSGGGDEKLSLTDRIMNGVGGGVIGEIGAIAAFPLLAALYNKAQGTRAGGKVLPSMRHGGGTAAPTSKMGKMMHFLTGTNKGRLLAAALTGGAFVAGKHAITGNGGASLGGEAASSFGTTLGLELALATLLPAALGRGKQWMDRRNQSRITANMGPHRPVVGGSLANANFTPAGVQRPGAGVTSPAMRNTLANVAAQRQGLVGPTLPPGVNPAVAGALAPKPTMMGRLAGMGKGILGHAGIFGTGMAAYDAYNTEGGLWDKTKAFGSSLLTTAAISKGLSTGGKLFTQAGRAGLMQGARTAAGFVGRQALWQGARSVAVAGLTGLASFVGAPVVLGGLAIAAVGAGLYFGYKKFFGTDKNAVMRYRMAQYGVDVDDQDKVTRIAQLESIAKKHIKITGNTGTFANSFPFKDALKIFGVSEGDAEHTQRFATWFTQRFKPVFIKGLTAYRALAKNDALEKADDLDKETKIKYLNDIGSLEASTYAILVMPFTSDKASKYDAKKVKKEYDQAVEKIGHEKGKGEKSLKDRMADSLSKGWDKIKSMAKDGWDVTRTALATARDAVVNAHTAAGSAISNFVKEKAPWVAEKAQQAGSWLKNTATSIGDGISNFVASMTGSQKEWQMMVYKAFKSAGFSEQQARILTAEIGRENSYNPKYLFGGHADPHKGTNLGMLSWQGDRKPRLIAHLNAMKVIDKNGNIAQNQAGLNAQAGFIMWELRNTHKKVGNEFLANPNISYQDGSYMIGKRYILWRIDDPKYRAQGIKNRDGFYNMLLKQLGASDGKGLTNGGDTKPGSAGSSAPPGISRAASTMVANASNAVAGGGRTAPGGGVLQRQYQNANGGGGVPSGGGAVVQSMPITGISPSHKAYKAAMYATKNALSASNGQCAKYVRVALMTGGGYPLKSWPVSAGDYATQGTLRTVGFEQINMSSQPQIGDVMIWSKVAAHAHGHIQIYNGKQWVSDFIQRTSMPWGKGANGSTATLWRDKTLMGKVISGSVDVKTPPATVQKAETKPDGGAAQKQQPQIQPAASSGPVKQTAPPVQRAPTQRPVTTTTTATDTALSTSNQNRSKAAAEATAAQEKILMEQLTVQRSMLKTLGEIRDRLPPVGSNKGATQTKAQLAASDLGSSRSQPINMDINLN